MGLNSSNCSLLPAPSTIVPLVQQDPAWENNAGHAYKSCDTISYDKVQVGLSSSRCISTRDSFLGIVGGAIVGGACERGTSMLTEGVVCPVARSGDMVWW